MKTGIFFGIGACVLMLVLAACFSSYGINEATLSLYLGSNHRAILGEWPPQNLDNVECEIKLSGPTGDIDLKAKGGQTVHVIVSPGNWNINVKAFIGNDLYATGSATASVKPGKNSASVQMYPANAVLPGNTLAAKLNWLTNNVQSSTSYTINVEADEAIAPYSFSYAGKSDITVYLTGGSTEKTVSLSGNGALFTVGAGVTLVLENNVTMKGHTTNNAALVCVSNGALIMNSGAKIIDNTNNDTVFSLVSGGGVALNGGTFTMNGGEISGNTTQYIGGGGGIFIFHGGIFSMHGGTITGNTVRNNTGVGGGVYADGTGGSITKDGGTITGYDPVNEPNGNVVKDSSVIIQSNRGHAVVSQILSVKRRETSAGPTVNLDSNVSGPAGGWEN